MTRAVRWVAILGAVLVVLTTGAYIGVRTLVHRFNSAIPQEDLFGNETTRTTTPGASASPTPSPTPPPGSDIKGPLNFLIVGVDTREDIKTWVPRADAIMILHINADLTKAYLTSLPRDLLVRVPPFPPAKFGGVSQTKLAHAMSYGARVPGSNIPNTAQGFQLTAMTVSEYTGIKRWDGGAVLTFRGLWKVVDALGGIDIYVDTRVTSIHMRPDGKHRAPCSSCAHGYGGPQMVYEVGKRHLTGWMALDYARQRYLPGGDYTRTRHQRQIIKAMITKALSTEFFTDPAKVDRLIKRLGEMVIFDGRGRQPSEFVYALRNLKPENLTLVGLPGGSAYSGGSYIGERLSGIQSQYFAALRRDALDEFLRANPKLVNSDPV